MRVRTRLLVLGTVIATVLPITAAHAGSTALTVAVDPDNAADGGTATVSGHLDTQQCSATAVTVTFGYNDYSDAAKTVDSSADLDGSGDYSTEITVPDDAKPGAATVSASAVCQPQTGAQSPRQPAPSRTAGPIPFTVNAAASVISDDPQSGPVDSSVDVSGDNCFGDGDNVVHLIFVYTSSGGQATAAFTAALAADHTYAATFTVPADADPGTAHFVIDGTAGDCPGTNAFSPASFDVVENAAPSPTPSPSPTEVPEAPPATGVGGVAQFTG